MSLPEGYVWAAIDEALLESSYLGGGALHLMSTYGCIYHVFRILCVDIEDGLGNGKTMFCPSAQAFNIDCQPQQSGVTYQHVYRRWCEANTKTERYNEVREMFHDLVTIKTDDGVIFNPRLLSACQAAASVLAAGLEGNIGEDSPVDMQSLIKSAEATIANWYRTCQTRIDCNCSKNKTKIFNLLYASKDVWSGALPVVGTGQMRPGVLGNVDTDGRRVSSRIDAGQLAPERNIFGTSASQAGAAGSRTAASGVPTPIKFKEIPSSFAEYARAMEQMQEVPNYNTTATNSTTSQNSSLVSQRQDTSPSKIPTLEEARRDNGIGATVPHTPQTRSTRPQGIEITRNSASGIGL